MGIITNREGRHRIGPDDSLVVVVLSMAAATMRAVPMP
jgi:hypothetical protein